MNRHNHNGGCIAFGPDGMLYAGFGDGGPQRDPPGHAQNPAELLGSMIRIDVDRQEGDLPYAIPDDNPLVADHQRGDSVRPEIWAMGFREPWRFSFDSVTGGYVCRANPDSSFYGVYLFGDYNTKRLWGLRHRTGRLIDVRELATAPGGVVSFGQDDRGEPILVTYGAGIWHLDLDATEYR